MERRTNVRNWFGGNRLGVCHPTHAYGGAVQTGETSLRYDLGDIGQPRPNRRIDGEPPIQRVVHDERRPIAIYARLPLLGNLRLNTCKAGQSRNAVLGFIIQTGLHSRLAELLLPFV